MTSCSWFTHICLLRQLVVIDGSRPWRTTMPLMVVLKTILIYFGMQLSPFYALKNHSTQILSAKINFSSKVLLVSFVKDIKGYLPVPMKGHFGLSLGPKWRICTPHRSKFIKSCIPYFLLEQDWTWFFWKTVQVAPWKFCG